jgi:glycosyltransferase involved in cell wall biosynthesis
VHILHVVPTYLPAVRYGGPIVAVHGLCRALAARGHKVDVFTTSIDGPGNSAVPHDVPVMLDGVTVRYFASPVLRRLSWAPGLARAVDREMDHPEGEGVAPQIVHLHSVFLWPTWAAARLARKARVPYVLSPRGMLVRRLIAQRHALVKSAWIRLVERENLEKATLIHATSAAEAEELGQFGFDLPPVVTIPNGVAAIETARIATPAADIRALAQAQPLILFLGRLSRVKGLDLLLAGFARTHAGTLAIVGNDYDNLVPALMRQARELNIAERVRFIPRAVTGAEKELVFASARGFVLPSHSESFGNAALEAMQRGLPVIVTAETGMSDIVRDSGGGIVVAGTPEDIGQAIEDLVRDPARALAMGDAGRRHVTARYGWDKVAAEMEAMYESLHAEGPGRA